MKAIPSAGVKKPLHCQPDHELSVSELKVHGSQGTESVIYFNPVARFNNGCSPSKEQTTGRFFFLSLQSCPIQ